MDIQESIRDRSLTLAFSGELDHHGARNALRRMDLALDAALPRTLVLDFGGVTFMDSSGIALILRARNRMELLDGSIQLRSVPAQARRVLDAAGIGNLLSVRQEGQAPEAGPGTGQSRDAGQGRDAGLETGRPAGRGANRETGVEARRESGQEARQTAEQGANRETGRAARRTAEQGTSRETGRAARRAAGQGTGRGTRQAARREGDAGRTPKAVKSKLKKQAR